MRRTSHTKNHHIHGILVEEKVLERDFRAYKELTPKLYKRARSMAVRLQGLRVLHINSTSQGGGVAELLSSQVPLERSLGVDSKWFTMQNVEPRFFEVTKKIHNLLQGRARSAFNVMDQDYYLKVLKRAADDLKTLTEEWKPDVVIIHDPQPLLLGAYLPEVTASVLRLHIDLSTPDAAALKFLRPHIEKFDRVVITSPRYRPRWLSKKKTRIIMPAIDPFAEKNQPAERAREALVVLNIHTDRPIISQISRFDPWKDPLGVIEAFYLAKNAIPDLQLILVGEMATDDPEAIELLKKVKRYAEGDPSIFFYTQSNDKMVNVIQTASDVILQKSIREGFGLTVTEAMWKEKAVVGGKTVGISRQIKNGKNGFLVKSPAGAARAIIKFIRNPELRKKIGKAAKRTVKEKFLMSRYILDHLKLYKELT